MDRTEQEPLDPFATSEIIDRRQRQRFLLRRLDDHCVINAYERGRVVQTSMPSRESDWPFVECAIRDEIDRVASALADEIDAIADADTTSALYGFLNTNFHMDLRIDPFNRNPNVEHPHREFIDRMREKNEATERPYGEELTQKLSGLALLLLWADLLADDGYRDVRLPEQGNEVTR